MFNELSAIEVRVLASLVEKQLTTPEYYPLTQNALTAACNQKSNREPVMSLGETEISAAIDRLRDENLVYLFYGSGSRTVKYKHMLPGVFELEPPETAVMTVLMLRGPQTIGEIRGSSGRLWEFTNLDDVQQALDSLSRREFPLITQLERQPGQKEARFAHLLSGKPSVEAGIRSAKAVVREDPGAGSRMDALESEVRRLATELAELRIMFADFRKHFE